jgi:hypothetical protein
MEEGTHRTPTGEATWSGMTATPWVEAATHGADKSQPDTTATPQVETTQIGPSLVRTEMDAPVTDAVQPDMTASLLTGSGQPGKNMAEASSATVVMGRTSVSAPSALPITKGAIPKEVAPMEGSAPLEVNAASSRALVHAGGDLHTWEGPALRWADQRNPGVTLFTLDDAAEEKD